MGEWKALKKTAGTGWKELDRESGTGWKALEWAYLFSDDFEDGTVDKWSKDASGGTISADNVIKHAGSYSMSFDPTVSYFEAWVTFTNTSKVKFDFYVYADVINMLNYWYGMETNTVLVEVMFRENGYISYRNGAALVDTQTYTNETWYHIEIEADCDTDKYDLWIDGDKKTTTQADFKNAGTNFNKFNLRGKINDPGHYDDVYIEAI